VRSDRDHVPAGRPRSHDHARAGWFSIIAGQVYRGRCYPDLVGYHFYTDIVANVLVRARLLDDDTLEMTDTADASWNQTSSIHADSRGELYVTKTGGEVYHLEAGP
jgi:hypothetical protein